MKVFDSVRERASQGAAVAVMVFITIIMVAAFFNLLDAEPLTLGELLVLIVFPASAGLAAALLPSRIFRGLL